MLDGLLGSSFGSKCKSLLRVTLMRVELVQRKRRATEKIQKKDLADLLATRLELDAYKRAEGLLAELRTSSGYDYIEDSCNWLLRNISSIGRRKECPEKCKEAVASLMFAAAWFSDLPELRDLRDLFHNRYGKSMEFYVNQKFAESLQNKHYAAEKKLRLMEHVAAEFSVKWNSANFKNRIRRDLVPPPVIKDQVMRKGSIDAPTRRKESINEGERLGKGHRPSEGKEKPIISRVTWYSLLHHDKKVSVKYYKPGRVKEKQEKREHVGPKRQIHYLVGGNGKRGVVCPPNNITSTYHLRRDAQAPGDNKFKQSESKRPVQQCQCGLKKDLLPDMRSVRVEPRRGELADADNRNKKLEGPIIVERKLAQPMTSGRTLQISIQEVNDEQEEMILDKLLIKYCIKPHSPEKCRVYSEDIPSNQTSIKAGEADDKLALFPCTKRSTSLPNEKTAPAEQERALIHVSSYQPNRLAPHVHPKLPDYDDLAYKFAALKQQQGS